MLYRRVKCELSCRKLITTKFRPASWELVVASEQLLLGCSAIVKGFFGLNWDLASSRSESRALLSARGHERVDDALLWLAQTLSLVPTHLLQKAVAHVVRSQLLCRRRCWLESTKTEWSFKHHKQYSTLLKSIRNCCYEVDTKQERTPEIILCTYAYVHDYAHLYFEQVI